MSQLLGSMSPLIWLLGFVVISLIIMVLGFLGIRAIIRHRRHSNQKLDFTNTEAKSESKLPLTYKCLVADQVKGKRVVDLVIEPSDQEYETKKAMLDDAVERQYHGEWVRFIKKFRDGRIEVPKIEMQFKKEKVMNELTKKQEEFTITPNALFVALEDRRSPRVFVAPESPYKGIATKALFIIAGVLAFICFLIVGINLQPTQPVAAQAQQPQTQIQQPVRK